jgi:hypothetical protein
MTARPAVVCLHALAEELIPADPNFSGPGCEPVAVYLTDSLCPARANAWKHSLSGEVLLVDVVGLPLVALSFYTCLIPIGPQRISRLADHPRLLRSLAQDSTRRLIDPAGWLSC